MNENQLEMDSFARGFVADTLENHPDCFCAALKPEYVGCDAENYTLTMNYVGEPWEQNPLGIVQGGVIAAMLDYTATVLSAAIFRGNPLTVTQQVSYLRPTPLGKTLVVKAECTKPGRSMVYTNAVIYALDAPDKTLATATAVFYRA